MNFTYIVGNGLDLQYGLKTRYRDFYEFQNKVYISRSRWLDLLARNYL
nr:AbiH family protein [Streptococcus pneumoniae]